MKRMYESEEYDTDYNKPNSTTSELHNMLEATVPDWVPNYFTLTDCTEREVKGYVESEANLEKLLEQHRQAQQCSFAKRTNDALCRGRREHRLKWCTDIKDKAIPCIVTMVAHKTCRYGGQRKTNVSKAKIRPEDRGYTKAGKLKTCRQSKKVGCPAQITLFYTTYYDEFECGPARRERAKKMTELKKQLKSDSKPRETLRIRVCLPREVAHSGHPVALPSTPVSSLSSEAMTKIYEFVSQGITSLPVIEGLLFIEEPLENERIPPNEKDIRLCVHTALALGLYKEFDQNNLRTYLSTLSDGPKIHLRIAKTNQQNSFLFVMQEKWQQDLMCRYGNGFFVLDAAYKATKFNLPHYQILCQTNSGYFPVAEFIIENEVKELLEEALRMLMDWNPNWKPRYWLTDCNQSEMSALESVFSSVEVYMFVPHCEVVWQKTLCNDNMGLNPDERRELLHLLHVLAFSSTREEYTAAQHAVTSSTPYLHNAKVHKYLAEDVIANITRWCALYVRPGFHAYVFTERGSESLSLTLRQAHFDFNGNKILSKLVKTLIQDYLPKQLTTYSMHQNGPSPKPRYTEDTLPSWLQDRPHNFTVHVLERLEQSRLISHTDMLRLEDGTHAIGGEVVHYTERIWPQCTCKEFRSSYLPCVHLFALLRFQKKTFMDLCAGYRNSVFINIDKRYVLQTNNGKNSENTSNKPNKTRNSINTDSFNEEANSPTGSEMDAIVPNARNCKRTVRQLQEDVRARIDNLITLLPYVRSKVKLIAISARVLHIKRMFMECAVKKIKKKFTKKGPVIRSLEGTKKSAVRAGKMKKGVKRLRNTRFMGRNSSQTAEVCAIEDNEPENNRQSQEGTERNGVSSTETNMETLKSCYVRLEKDAHVEKSLQLTQAESQPNTSSLEKNYQNSTQQNPNNSKPLQMHDRLLFTPPGSSSIVTSQERYKSALIPQPIKNRPEIAEPVTVIQEIASPASAIAVNNTDISLASQSLVNSGMTSLPIVLTSQISNFVLTQEQPAADLTNGLSEDTGLSVNLDNMSSLNALVTAAAQHQHIQQQQQQAQQQQQIQQHHHPQQQQHFQQSQIQQQQLQPNNVSDEQLQQNQQLLQQNQLRHQEQQNLFIPCNQFHNSSVTSQSDGEIVSIQAVRGQTVEYIVTEFQ